MIKGELELLSIEEDITSQQLFIMTLINMLKDIIQSKTEGKISEMEIGFKLGEIFRMLHEFHADTKKLSGEVKLLLIKLKEEKENGKHILLD